MRDAAGQFHACEPKEQRAGGYRVDDARADATVTSMGPDQWELTLTAKTNLTEVWFPWPSAQIEPSAAGGAAIYVAQVGGLRIRAAALKEFAWEGAMYPSGCFAPVLIQADERAAFLVAALNWPPREVRPLHSLDRLSLRYDEHIASGTRKTYRALIKRVEGDEPAGRPPWLLAIEEYRNWLTARMREERLLPIDHPQWLREADGWIFVNLQNMPRFSIADLELMWTRWNGVLPWMQIWGQMSNYHGPRHLASPPLAPGEETGCCLNNPRMHARYLPELPAFARRVATQARIGFYTRPGPERPRLDTVSPGGGPGQDLRALLDWITRNRDEYGANAVYIDILGNLYCGDILTVARLIRDRFPPGTVIEYSADCYPAATLLSGSLSSGGNVTPQSFARGRVPDKIPFPRLARALFCDRIVFYGGANGDWDWWGSKNTYRAERNAFLLGGKLDAFELEDQPNTGLLNRAVDAILTARKRVDWWKREPVYRDVLDITNVTSGIEVRRFTGKNGEELFAVDNWSRRPNASFRFRGREIRMGDDPLSIAVLSAGQAVQPP